MCCTQQQPTPKKTAFETELSKNQFALWIPNTTGRIYTRLSNLSSKYGEKDNYQANFTTVQNHKTSRHIVFSACKSHIDTKFNLLDKKLPHQSDTRMICAMEQENDELFTGSLYAFFNISQNELSYKQNNTKTSSDIETFLATENELNKLLAESDALNQYLKEQEADALSFNDLVPIKNALKSRFDSIKDKSEQLYQLSLNNPKHDSDFFVIKISISLFRDGGWLLFSSENPGHDEKALHPVTCSSEVNRVYKLFGYFIKQFFHQNMHHDPDHDSITGITNLNKYKEDIEAGNFAPAIYKIMLHQLGFIKRATLDIMRRSSYTSGNPLGFNIYSQSLIANSKHLIKNLSRTNNVREENKILATEEATKIFHENLVETVKNTSRENVLVKNGLISIIFTWSIPTTLLLLSFYNLQLGLFNACHCIKTIPIASADTQYPTAYVILYGILLGSILVMMHLFASKQRMLRGNPLLQENQFFTINSLKLNTYRYKITNQAPNIELKNNWLLSLTARLIDKFRRKIYYRHIRKSLNTNRKLHSAAALGIFIIGSFLIWLKFYS